MARNILLTATTADKMLEILKGTDFEQANKLHKLGKEINCKVEPRTGAHYYRIQYSTPKPKRSLFTIECNEKRWRVKANLYNISQYMELTAECSDTVKNAIKSTRTCTRCNSRCIGGSHFEMDGKAYFTCIGSGHFFENMNSKDWDSLAVLLKRENEIMLNMENLYN